MGPGPAACKANPCTPLSRAHRSLFRLGTQVSGAGTFRAVWAQWERTVLVPAPPLSHTPPPAPCHSYVQQRPGPGYQGQATDARPWPASSGASLKAHQGGVSGGPHDCRRSGPKSFCSVARCFCSENVMQTQPGQEVRPSPALGCQGVCRVPGNSPRHAPVWEAAGGAARGEGVPQGPTRAGAAVGLRILSGSGSTLWTGEASMIPASGPH